MVVIRTELFSGGGENLALGGMNSLPPEVLH